MEIVRSLICSNCSSETRLFSRSLRFSHPHTRSQHPFGYLSTINVITGWKVFEEAKLIRFPSLFYLSISLFINVEKISNQLQFKELVSIFQSKISWTWNVGSITVGQLTQANLDPPPPPWPPPPILREVWDSSVHFWDAPFSSWIHYYWRIIIISYCWFNCIYDNL